MRKTACYFHARCRVGLFNLQNGSQKEIADREAEAATSFHAPRVGRVVFFHRCENNCGKISEVSRDWHLYLHATSVSLSCRENGRLEQGLILSRKARQ